jgi:hypothetical protein
VADHLLSGHPGQQLVGGIDFGISPLGILDGDRNRDGIDQRALEIQLCLKLLFGESPGGRLTSQSILRAQRDPNKDDDGCQVWPDASQNLLP